LIRTTTERPLCVTRTLLPNGSVRCAAVYCAGSKRSPLAVLRPANSRPYQLATPLPMTVPSAPSGAAGAGTIAGSSNGAKASMKPALESTGGSAEGTKRGSSTLASAVVAAGVAMPASSSARAGPIEPPSARRARAAAATAFMVGVPSMSGQGYGRFRSCETRPGSLHPVEGSTRPGTGNR
jgi:hypothetical protein